MKQLPKSHRQPDDPKQIKKEAGKVMSEKQWESSATDAAKDRKVAKSKGQTLKEYEGSPLDEKNDKKQRAAHNAKARKAR